MAPLYPRFIRFPVVIVRNSAHAYTFALGPKFSVWPVGVSSCFKRIPELILVLFVHQIVYFVHAWLYQTLGSLPNMNLERSQFDTRRYFRAKVLGYSKDQQIRNPESRLIGTPRRRFSRQERATRLLHFRPLVTQNRLISWMKCSLYSVNTVLVILVRAISFSRTARS